MARSRSPTRPSPITPAGADGGAIADAWHTRRSPTAPSRIIRPRLAAASTTRVCLTVIGSTIESNTANNSGGFGGGIDNDDGGMATLTSTTVEMNSAVVRRRWHLQRGSEHARRSPTAPSRPTRPQSGGGICQQQRRSASTMTVTDSTLSGNEATGTSSQRRRRRCL